MNAENYTRLIRREPFTPHRVILADGAEYLIRKSNRTLPTKSGLIIAASEPDEGDDYITVPWTEIREVSDLNLSEATA